MREHLVEREARGDGLAHLVERERFLEPQVLGREALLLEPALDDVDDLFDLERLEDVVVGAALHRVDRGLDRAEAGHDDGERVGRGLADRLEQLDAAHARHLQIADDEVVVRAIELAERARAVLGGADDVAFHPEEVREDVADELLVVDDQHTWALFGGMRHFEWASVGGSWAAHGFLHASVGGARPIKLSLSSVVSRLRGQVAHSSQNHHQLARQGVLDAKGNARRGMSKDETGAVQERAVERVLLFEMSVGGCVSVSRIAHYGVPHTREPALDLEFRVQIRAHRDE